MSGIWLAVVSVYWIDVARVECYSSFVQNWWECCNVLRWAGDPVVWRYPTDSDEALYNADLCQTNRGSCGRAAYTVLPDSATGCSDGLVEAETNDTKVEEVLAEDSSVT